MSIITLTTDFGLEDGYVAAMRGVILGLGPSLTVVDVSHAIAAQAAPQAAYVLSTVVPYYPPQAVHLVVVDPGVGSARRPMALRCAWGTFVGPDNGVIPAALDFLGAWGAWQAAHLTRPAYWRAAEVSATFHGRDIFAPVAAHLALGAPIEDVGEPLSDPLRLPDIRPTRTEDGGWDGVVIHVDHFGNLITNIPGSAVAGGAASVEAAGVTMPVVRTYADVAVGEALAYVGSSGLVEVAVRDGRAAARLGVGVGAPVRLRCNPRES
ncbi:MAG: SAM-dependent chlorinase/fluorinase [Anaerolineae bacterium]